MIQVAAAIIENEHRQLLIARKKAGKPQAGLWEFPGGKFEAGETPAECLKRELQEEMQIAIEPYAYFGTNDHRYGDKHIRLIAYKARFISGTIKLADHDEARWVERDELGEYAFAPADVAFVNRLMEREELSSPGSDADSTEASDIKTILRQSYDNHADLRNSSELEGWKAEERDQVLSAFRANDVRSVLEIGAGPGRAGTVYFFRSRASI